MTRLFKGIKGIVSLAVLAFIICVIGGIYTALDCATAISPQASEAIANELAVPPIATSAFMKAIEEMAEEAQALTVDADTEPGGGTQDGVAEAAPASQDAPTSNSGVSPSSNAPSSIPSAGSAQAPSRKWVEPVYKTVHHEAEYTTTDHAAQYSTTTEYFTQCNDCSYKVQGSIYPHQDATGHGRYSTDVPVTSKVLTKEAWTEKTLVKEAWDERVLVTAGYWE